MQSLVFKLLAKKKFNVTVLPSISDMTNDGIVTVMFNDSMFIPYNISSLRDNKTLSFKIHKGDSTDVLNKVANITDW